MDFLTEAATCRIRKDREISERESIESILWQIERRVRTMCSVAQRFVDNESERCDLRKDDLTLKFNVMTEVCELLCEYVDDKMDTITALRKKLNDDFINMTIGDLRRRERETTEPDESSPSTATL